VTTFCSPIGQNNTRGKFERIPGNFMNEIDLRPSWLRPFFLSTNQKVVFRWRKQGNPGLMLKIATKSCDQIERWDSTGSIDTQHAGGFHQETGEFGSQLLWKKHAKEPLFFSFYAIKLKVYVQVTICTWIRCYIRFWFGRQVAQFMLLAQNFTGLQTMKGRWRQLFSKITIIFSKSDREIGRHRSLSGKQWVNRY